MRVKTEVLKALKRCTLVTKGISANVYRCPASVRVDDIELVGFATDGHAAVQWSLGVHDLIDEHPSEAWCGVPPHMFRVVEDYGYYVDHVEWEAGNCFASGSKGVIAQFGRQIFSEMRDDVLELPDRGYGLLFEGKAKELFEQISWLEPDENRVRRLVLGGVTLDAGLVSAVLKVIDRHDVVKVYTSGVLDPVFFRCEAEKYYKAVVMPMKV
jgi:hypothetical protein